MLPYFCISTTLLPQRQQYTGEHHRVSYTDVGPCSMSCVKGKSVPFSSPFPQDDIRLSQSSPSYVSIKIEFKLNSLICALEA